MKADFKVAVKAPFASKPMRGKPRPRKAKAAEPQSPRPPRIAVLMALAIHMEQLLRDGHVKDCTDLAKLTGVTRARITQVMGLLVLAPDIQEQLLFAEPMESCVENTPERTVRPLVAVINWARQRLLFPRITGELKENGSCHMHG